MQEPQTLVFGPFCLDRRDERLWRGQEVLPLYPKSFAVLCCLVTQAGQLVTKDALLEAVWPKTAVSESALTVAIRHLGRVLGDRARTLQFIETVHRRGYRFMAPVAVAEPFPQRHQTAGTWRLPQPVACVQSALFVGREGELTQMYQWSDRATLEWLAYVARRPDPARLLILGTYRPVGAMVQAHPLRAVLTELRQHGQCVELVLDYLSETEVTAYLCQRFGGTRLVAALVRVLHRRTQGNPLFLNAVVDELVRQQVMIEGPDGLDVRGGVETINALVPAHLLALIELQLAHLNREDQTLLEAASVGGVEFSAAAVAAAVERADEVVEARCTTLAQQGQFLRVRNRAEWPDGTVATCYGFLHALYQDVLYQRVPAGRQTRWHARIGTRLAHGFGESAGEMAAALAMHFGRGRLTPQAIPYLRHAGRQAFQRAAYQEALAFYEQALHAVEQLPTTPDTLAQAIDLRFDLCRTLWPLAEFGRIVDHLRAAERLAETLQDQRRLAWSLSHMTGCFMNMGEHIAVIESGQRALTIASALKEVALQAATTIYLGIAYHYLGEYDRAIAILTRTVVSLEGELLYERFDLPTVPSVSARAWLAHYLAELGEFTQGIARGEEAVRLAEAVDNPSSLIVAYAGIGSLYLCKGDLHQAISALEHGLRICRDTMLDNLVLFRIVASRLGYAYALSGRITEALTLLEQAIEWAPSRRAEVAHRQYIAWLGESYLMAGRQNEAMDLARQAIELSRAYNERGHQVWALRLLGEVAARCGPPEHDQAGDYYQEALALAQELGMRPLLAHCYLGLGTLDAKIGRREQADAELSTAIELYRAMDMTFWLPQAEATMASLRGGAG